MQVCKFPEMVAQWRGREEKTARNKSVLQPAKLFRFNFLVEF